MTQTPNLELTEVSEADTPAAEDLNDSFWAIDTILQLAVIDKDLATPPSDAVQGDRYIIPEGATGAWAGRTRHIAYMTPAGWRFRAPRDGWIAMVTDEDVPYRFQDTDWVLMIDPTSVDMLLAIDGSNAASSSYQVDFLAAGAYEIILTGNVELTFAAVPEPGKVYRTTLILRQDSVGGRTVTWPVATFWAAGSAPLVSTQPYAVNVYEVVSYDGVAFYARLLIGSAARGSDAPPTYPAGSPTSIPYSRDVAPKKRILGATWVNTGGDAVQVPTGDVFVRAPNRGMITRVTVLTTGGPGDCEIDVWVDTLANYPPANADSIVASAPPIISAGTFYEDSTLSGWSRNIEVDDVVGFHLEDSSTFTSVTVQLEIEEYQ